MAGQTPTYGLPYQTLADPPHGPNLGQDLAEAVDAELARVDADVAVLDQPAIAVLWQSAAAGQSIPNGTWASLAFDVEEQDRVDGHSTVTNTSRYTCRVAGWYWLSGAVAWAGNATGRRLARWAVNGGVIFASRIDSAATTTAGAVAPAPTRLVKLQVNDYLELQVLHDSGGALATIHNAEAASYMSLCRASL